jgi:hypothetical protein
MIVLDRNDLLSPLRTGIMLLLLFSLFLLLFAHCVYVDIHTVIRIYVCCNNLYAHCPQQDSLLRSSTAQTVDGNFRLTAPGFRASASP